MSQKSSCAALDSSMRRLHTDMHHLADTVFDIAQRLEDKLDWLAESASSGGGGQHRPFPRTREYASGAGHKNSSSSSVRWGAGVDGLRKEKTAQDTDPVKEDISKLDPVDIRLSYGTDSDKKISECRLLEREVPGRDKYWRSTGDLRCVGASETAHEQQQTTGELRDLGTKFVAMDKKLERISNSLGLKAGIDDGNDEEDRRRLKEKLKVAIEVDRRSHIRAIVSRSEVWIEYIFGICSPDKRLGKRGSR